MTEDATSHAPISRAEFDAGKVNLSELHSGVPANRTSASSPCHMLRHMVDPHAPSASID